MQKKERIHSRTITVNSYEIDDSSLLVEGDLVDERFFPSFYYSRNEFLDPGIVHDIRVEMKVSLPALEITEARAHMRKIPIGDCLGVESSAERIVGLRIKPGFARDLKDRLGGIAGCLHMTTLIYNMGAAAVQGMWASVSRKREGGGTRSLDYDPGILKNSCWLWRENGPFYEGVKKLRGERGKEA
ncbi:MAG TPA: DUF2889 domain-containing protein [Syntrophales bacterium]